MQINPKKLRLYRHNAKKTMEEAAEAIGVEPKTIAAWEQGVKAPRGQQLTKLAGLYGCHIDDFSVLRIGEIAI